MTTQSQKEKKVSSENNHWSMKDREDWDQDDWDQFQKETTYCKEVEEAVESVLPAVTLQWSKPKADHAQLHPDWDTNYGRCSQLMWQVMREQKGMETIVCDFVFMVEKFTIGVTLNGVACNLDQAYAAAGYINHPYPRLALDPLPF
tara:strand:+ start:82 stop:519 length:438 start_codon:yes stop_codon:yes gene_type:complete